MPYIAKKQVPGLNELHAIFAFYKTVERATKAVEIALNGRTRQERPVAKAVTASVTESEPKAAKVKWGRGTVSSGKLKSLGDEGRMLAGQYMRSFRGLSKKQAAMVKGIRGSEGIRRAIQRARNLRVDTK